MKKVTVYRIIGAMALSLIMWFHDVLPFYLDALERGPDEHIPIPHLAMVPVFTIVLLLVTLPTGALIGGFIARKFFSGPTDQSK